MNKMQEEIKVNIYDRDEVMERCYALNCTPYDLFIACKKVGDSYLNVKKCIESKINRKCKAKSGVK